MYRLLSEDKKLELRQQYESRQEYMVAYNAINVTSERYEDLSPEEIWNEALAVVEEIRKSAHREWKVDKVFNQLKRKYSVFVDESDVRVERSEKQQEMTATLVLFDVVCMLSLAERVKPEEAERHPYFEYMRTILGYFCESVLFQAMLAVLKHDEEEVENIVGHDLQEVDYMDGVPAAKPVTKETNWDDDKFRRSCLRKIYAALKEQLKEQFKGGSQWFYVYRVMADLTIYSANSYKPFASDLEAIKVTKEHMPNTNTFSRKQNQLKQGTRYPNWQVKTGGKQTVLDEGKRIAQIAFNIINA